MSEMEIYTFGGGEILWKVFNGLALLFQSGNPYVTSTVKLSGSIGAIWAILRAIYGHNIGVFAKQWFVPTFILLNVLFLPKTSVHVIDRVDSHFVYSKIDHVPLGAAFVASVMSRISVFLTETFEEVWMPIEVSRFGKTGTMFAAKLISASSDLRIKDPISRDNIKNFLSRCYIWPYILGNVKGLEREARLSDDILGFISKNPHPSMGTYWAYEDGHTEFRYCKSCVSDVKELMSQEVTGSFATLAKKLFSWDAEKDPTGQVVTQRLKGYFPHAWEKLAGHTNQAHLILQQQLMLNASRESLDDQRDKFGHERLWSTLIAMESSRTQEKQTLMEMIRGDIAGSWIPTLQVIMLSMLILMFALVVPMTFLPGGFQLLLTWTKLMIWVQIWPVFSALLNCLGLMFAAKAGHTLMHDGGGALNFITQNGLSHIAHQASAWVQGLQLSVPFLSWAVVSGSGYAITNLASSMSQTLDSGASQAATEVVEGNMSFDNQSFHNRSVALQQYARQDIGPKTDFSQVMDTGNLIKTTNPMTGESDYQQRISSLKSSFTQTDSLSADLSQASSQSLAVTQAQEKSYNESLSRLSTQSQALLDAVSKGKVINQGWSQEEQAHFAKSAGEISQGMKQYQQDYALNRGKDLKGSLSGAFILGSSGEVGAHAGHQRTQQELEQYGLTKHHQEDLSHILQAARQNSLTSHGSQDQNHSLEWRHALDETKQSSKMYQASLTRSNNLEKAAHLAQSQGFTVSTDMTDDVLEAVAHSHFAGNKDLAVELATRNPEAFQALSGPYIQERKSGFIQWIGDQQTSLSEGDILSEFKAWSSPKVEKALPDYSFERTSVQEGGPGLQFNPERLSDISSNVASKIDERGGFLAQSYEGAGSTFGIEESKWNVRRLGEEVFSISPESMTPEDKILATRPPADLQKVKNSLEGIQESLKKLKKP